MTTVLASTFSDALAKLNHNEQKQVKITAYDLQIDPTGNGLQLHRVNKSPGFWTARVSRDVRIVLHKEGETTVLAWVGHHDEAYRWAERRKLVQHERTGAMQFVPVIDRDTRTLAAFEASPRSVPAAVTLREAGENFAGVQDNGDGRIVAVQAKSPHTKPFADLTDDQMLDVGVPRDWLEAVRVTEEAAVDELFDLLPSESAEALLDFVTGGRLEDHVASKAEAGADPFQHPDALRRFRILENAEELQAALDQPFEKWAVFLHPVQREIVDQEWNGPVRVSGSAGTGKTIVAIHRAARLADRNRDAQVLLTTFSKPLAQALTRKLEVLAEISGEAIDRVKVATLDQAAITLFTRWYRQPNLATSSQVRAAIADARKAGLAERLTESFLFEEWDELVDAWGVDSSDEYARLPRIGRKTRLGSVQREEAWAVFAFVRNRLSDRSLITLAQIYRSLCEGLATGRPIPFTHIVVDEAQDLSVAQVRFLAAISKLRADAAFLCGDIGQRIFHLPFSWLRLGLDIRGRSHSLKVNYRTSHQIRLAADRLLPPAITDLDGIADDRTGTVSTFDGPDPEILLCESESEEIELSAAKIRDWVSLGVAPNNIGVLTRSQGQLGRARNAVKEAGFDPRDETGPAIRTMHDAKGLEFGAVIVMACDEDVLPDPARIASIADTADIEAANETERHLLYVACTRARDHLLITAVEPGSEFIEEMMVSES